MLNYYLLLLSIITQILETCYVYIYTYSDVENFKFPQIVLLELQQNT